ncbi:hypothetical protein C0J52_23523, partial [Blattella germanica]
GGQRTGYNSTESENSVVIRRKKSVVIQRRFRQHFNTKWAPVKNTINRLYRQFETNEMPEPKQPRVSQIRSPENDNAPYSSQSSQRRKATFCHLTVPTSIPVIAFFGVLKGTSVPSASWRSIGTQNCIVQVCNTIYEDLCLRVVRNMSVRLEERLWQNGDNIEHVLR